MRAKINLLVIILILVLPVTLYALFKAPTNASLNAATGKPIVLVFSTPMCSECVKFKKVLEVVEPKYSKKVSFQKINAAVMDNDTQDKIQKYEVKVVPTIIFINKEGQNVLKREGSMSKEMLELKLDELTK